MRQFLFFICLVVTSTFADAQINFSAPQGYVNDYAKILSVEQVIKLNNILYQFEQQTSNQVVVATFDSLYGQPLENFSLKLSEHWKIGSSKHDNGVLLLIIKNDHKIRIEVGYGLEGALTDATSSSIIRNQITPFFKKNDYASGVENGVVAILQAIKGEYKSENIADSNFYNTTGFWVFIIFLSLLLTYTHQRRIKIPIIDFLFMTLAMVLSQKNKNRTADGFSNYSHTTTDDNKSNNSDGFSGGGGKFGGGGASGDW